jgi:Glycosyl transferases group 1
MRKSIIVAGSLAQRPFIGGMAWVFLQYLLGFRRLGWDVVFVDRLEPGMCVDEAGRSAPFRSSANLRYLADVMRGFGLQDRWSLLYDGGREVAGLSREHVVELAARSSLLLNVMGYLDDEDILAAAPRRAFLDIDPGFGQMWRALGLHDLFQGHDHYVTVGERIGAADCAVPTGGISWVTTKPPVELSEWPATNGKGSGFTSVASWRGAFGPLEYDGRTYGLRVHEFRRFFELPGLTSAPFEVALDIDEAEVEDLRRLRQHGWRLADPREAAGDPWLYRDYVRRSSAELLIAKNMYVETRCGWFSDRSACYLASGKPVLAQDTGLEGLLPNGEGLLTFSTLDEAVAGVEEITGDYQRHSHAARAIAEEHFAAERVLRRLLDILGVG